jgi:hypothetical protein
MEQALHAELREQNLCFHCGVYNHLRENCYTSEKTATLQRKLLHFRENCYTSEKTVRSFRWDYGLCLRCGLPGHMARDCSCYNNASLYAMD